MKTSARNQFVGVIKSVDLAPVSAQVVITATSGVEVIATMTRESAQRLNARVGQQAVALVKASSVIVVTDTDGYQMSARNQFAGTVAAVERGAVSSIVTIGLAGGFRVFASVTNDAVDDLALAPGVQATAIFKAYAVVVGVRP